MAIAFDAKSNGAQTGATTTFSHTCTGSNLVLVVHVMTSSTLDTVSSVTYNGVAMTLAKQQRTLYTYYLVNPATGANNVVVTNANSTGEGSCAAAVSYTGAGGIGANASQDIAGTSPQTLAVTTTFDNSWLVGVTGQLSGSPSNPPFTAGTSTTARDSSNITGAAITSVDSNAAKTPTGSYSLETTGTPAGTSYRQIVVELTPYSPLATGGAMMAFF